MLCALGFLFWSGSVRAAQSTLAVAACGDLWPYSGMGTDSQLAGFDVELWGLVYSEMLDVAQHATDANVLALLGDSPPAIQRKTRAEILQGVKDGSLDVGLCGFQVSSGEYAALDYSPPLVHSGYRPIVKYDIPAVTGRTVLVESFKGFNEPAVFSLLMLMILSIVNAHLLWVLERHENSHIHKEYGWGVFDAWWLSLVTALTVGYGDRVPVTFGGRLWTICWMFIGTYCVGMFGAAVTSDVLAGSGEQMVGLGALKTLSDLARSTRVGVADAIVQKHVSNTVPGISVSLFADSQALLKALVDGVIEVAVDEQWSARWQIEHEASLKGHNLLPVGDVFSAKPRAFIISRQALAGGGTRSHTILPTLSQAVTRLMWEDGGRFQTVYLAWMLQHDPTVMESYSDAIQAALYFWNWVYGMGLAAFMLLWSGCVLIHYRKEIAQRRVKDGLIMAMGLGAKFTQKELREAAHSFFRAVDVDGYATVARILCDEREDQVTRATDIRHR